MFERLQHKWKVGGLQLFLILCTFAIGGSVTGFTGKKIMNLLNMDRNAGWFIVYIILITLLWPVAVLLISIPFGQFRFFSGYLRKMGRRLKILRSGTNNAADPGTRRPLTQNDHHSGQPTTPTPDPPHKVAIFASGAGSNAAKIIDHFRNNDRVTIALIVCNRPRAGVIAIAEKQGVPVLMIDKEKFFRGNAYVDELHSAGITFIVLAGFLWKIPSALVQAYQRKIVNIHPALLPLHGGKGMYGHHVHQAVINAKESQTGISIHYVDEQYDNGDIIFQAAVAVESTDTASSLAEKVHVLEHEHFPRIIERLLIG